MTFPTPRLAAATGVAWVALAWRGRGWVVGGGVGRRTMRAIRGLPLDLRQET